MKKRILTTMLMALASFFAVISCSKPEHDSRTNNDEYYVKYLFEAANNVGDTHYRDCSISFTSDEGQVKMAFKTVLRLSHEVVTGPFKYGSRVYATLNGGGFPKTSIQIFVSKNDSPFALKRMDNGGRLDYTIDY